MKSRKILESEVSDILTRWAKYEVVKELLERMTVDDLNDFVSNYGE